MDASVRVIGLERLRATMAAAGRELEHLPAHTAVARYVASRSAIAAPRRTGRLAASLRGRNEAAAAVTESNVPYAAVIENGWPAHHIRPHRFVYRTVTANESRIVAMYAADVDRIVGTIKGA